MKNFSLILLLLISFLLKFNLIAQTPADTAKPATHYSEIKGYIGVVHPLYTWSKDGNVANFNTYYIVGNPWGINIWKSKSLD